MRLRLLGADQQLSRPRLDHAHCFHCVQHQVQDDLLQLNAIPLYGKQSLRKEAALAEARCVVALVSFTARGGAIAANTSARPTACLTIADSNFDLR
jgi:hypothetical protein